LGSNDVERLFSGVNFEEQKVEETKSRRDS